MEGNTLKTSIPLEGVVDGEAVDGSLTLDKQKLLIHLKKIQNNTNAEVTAWGGAVVLRSTIKVLEIRLED